MDAPMIWLPPMAVDTKGLQILPRAIPAITVAVMGMQQRSVVRQVNQALLAFPADRGSIVVGYLAPIVGIPECRRVDRASPWLMLEQCAVRLEELGEVEAVPYKTSLFPRPGGTLVVELGQARHTDEQRSKPLDLPATLVIVTYNMKDPVDPGRRDVALKSPRASHTTENLAICQMHLLARVQVPVQDIPDAAALVRDVEENVPPLIYQNSAPALDFA